MARRRKSDIDEFISLPDSEKDRIFRELDAEAPDQSLARSRPLNSKERAQWHRFKKLGRPKVGQGAKTISLTVEKGLLKRADAYARQHGMSRAQLIARGIQVILNSAA